MDDSHPAVRMLNRAFASDPAAVCSLIWNRVPCNRALADDPHVVAGSYLNYVKGPVVGALGLLNGLLSEMGMPPVAARFDQTMNPDGSHTLLGFQVYTPPAAEGAGE